MSGYRWEITKDYCAADGDVGVAYGKGYAESGQNEAVFVMYDAAGNPCLEGVIIGDYTGDEPLEDFGRPCTSCVSIRVFK